MTDDYNRFIKAFKAATAGLTVNEVAEKLRVAPSTVYMWFQQKNCMNADAILRACWVFGIDVRAIYHEKWRALP